MSANDALQRERLRQQALLQTLWRQQPDAALQPWLAAADPRRRERGLATYRANAGAHAERALQDAFPTVRALIGEAAFAALARTLWRVQPPTQGDLARFGAALPGFLRDDGGLPEQPWLADSARLDWALAEAESAADAPADPASFALLARVDPQQLWPRLAPGFTVVRSAHPIVTIRARQLDSGSSAAAVAMAPAHDAGIALVWRQGWKACTLAIDEADARWCEALRHGLSIGAALEQGGTGFDFERWLRQALSQGWLLGVGEGEGSAGVRPGPRRATVLPHRS